MKKIRDTVEDGLRKICGRMTPDRRVITIAVLLVVFAAVNIWVTLSAIFSIGRGEPRQDRIELTPIEVPDFDPDGDGAPGGKPVTLEEFINEHFNSEENDTANTEQGQTEP